MNSQTEIQGLLGEESVASWLSLESAVNKHKTSIYYSKNYIMYKNALYSLKLLQKSFTHSKDRTSVVFFSSCNQFHNNLCQKQKVSVRQK